MMNFVLDPLGDGISRVSLVDHMGGDLSVVNDARSSFEKVSFRLDAADIKLLRWLHKEKSKSPLRGTAFKFRVKAPLSIARQWWKHVVASTHVDGQNGWNERSFRFTEVDPEFYTPKEFRYQAKTNKQSSEGVIPDDELPTIYTEACQAAYKAYKEMLSRGVCREQARLVLPPCIYTTWTWTVSLDALVNFIQLRQENSAQREIAAYAEAILKLITPIVPNVIEVWLSPQDDKK